MDCVVGLLIIIIMKVPVAAVAVTGQSVLSGRSRNKEEKKSVGLIQLKDNNAGPGTRSSFLLLLYCTVQ
jgi:hypothetical protein